MNYQQFSQQDKNIFLIDMRREITYPFSELAEKGLHKIFKAGQRVLIINNKTGYAGGTICQDCGHIPECNACSVPIAFHQDHAGVYFGICHICKAQYPGPGTCQQCGGHDVETYGIGTQQIADIVMQQFKQPSLLIDSSNANSSKKVQKLLSQVDTYQCVIGTSLLTSSIGNKGFDLVLVPHADMGINYPDYQSNRYNFLILHELIQKQSTPTFLFQSYDPEHYALQHACSGNISAMQTEELARRQQHQYPPYTDMCMIRYKHEVEERLYNSVNKLYQELLFLKQTYQQDQLEIYTTPPLIYKMYHKYRYNILLKGPQLRHFVDIIYSKLKLPNRGFKLDRHPESITT